MRLILTSATLLFQALPAFPQEHADTDNKISNVLDRLQLRTSSDGGLNPRGLHRNKMQRSMLRAPAQVYGNDLILKNSISNRVVKECNPDAEDADVGILSCGRDQYCKPNESSELGGICSAVERKLFFGYIPNTCPSSCNCTVSSTSKTGYIRCPYYYCGTFCLNQTICAYEAKIQYFVQGAKSKYVDCLYFLKPYNVTTCYYSSGNTCTYKVDNVTCNYCHPYAGIDCTNVPHGIKSGYSLPIVTAWNRQGGSFCTPKTSVPGPSPTSPPVPAPTSPPVPAPTSPPVPAPTPPPTSPPVPAPTPPPTSPPLPAPTSPPVPAPTTPPVPAPTTPPVPAPTTPPVPAPTLSPVPPPTSPPVPAPTLSPAPPPTPSPTQPACSLLHEDCSNQPCCSAFYLCRLREVGGVPICSAPNEFTTQPSLANTTLGGSAGLARIGGLL